MSDTAPARHAGDCNRHGDHRLSSRFERERHFGSDVAHVSHVTIPGRSLQPLCYFLGEKVTQKHFHTAARWGVSMKVLLRAPARGAGTDRVRRDRRTLSVPKLRCPCRLQAAHNFMYIWKSVHFFFSLSANRIPAATANLITV